jgi:hypothetical protein
MGKLYGLLIAMVLVFAAAMSFITLGVYQSEWGWSLVGVAVLVVFLATGPILPRIIRSLPEGRRRYGYALLQLLGAICLLLFLVMGIITWALGNRTYASNNAYQVLGLLLFLGLIGLGVPGVVATTARAFYVYHEARPEPPPHEHEVAHA